MNARNFSSTYAAILDLLFQTETMDNNMYTIEFDNGQFKRVKLDSTTKRPSQGITITDDTLFNKCTPAQWYLVGLICSQIKIYNALWLCPEEVKKSSTNKQAIKGLIELNILIKTETTHIYLVNPLYIRKGDFHTVLITTAKILMNTPKVMPEHVTNKKPVNELDIPNNHASQIGYGFVG